MDNHAIGGVCGNTIGVKHEVLHATGTSPFFTLFSHLPPQRCSMLTKLPTELLWVVLGFLDFDDLETLLAFKAIEEVVRKHLQCHYSFHCQITAILNLFEGFPSAQRQKQRTCNDLAPQLLQHICRIVETLPKYDHRAQFTHLLQALQHLVLKRILSPTMAPGLENDYASLCLEVRDIYLRTPSIRELHDAKYRRRSTKYTLAPFLPSDFTSVWRGHCVSAAEFYRQQRVPFLLAHPPFHHFATCKHSLFLARNVRLRFARFFGTLFNPTSLYLESSLDNTFEECVREALIAGDVESLLVICSVSGRRVDVENMCRMVTHAGELLWNYLDTMEDRLARNPTPQERARIENNQDNELTSPPDWLIPDRYKVHPDTHLRLKLMNNLHKKGWRWFD